MAIADLLHSPPSEQNTWTVDQFDRAVKYVDKTREAANR